MNDALKMIVGYIEELDAKQVLSQDEIMDYAQWSGRLASCGYPEHMIKFFDRFNAFEIDSMLKKRAAESINDIKEAFGEFLAVEIFTVQDFVCFVNHSPKQFKAETIDVICFWSRWVNATPLDQEAVETLKAYKRSYPLNKDDLIEKIMDPMSAEEERLYNNILFLLTQPDIDAETEELSKSVDVSLVSAAEGIVTVEITGIDPKLIYKVRQRWIPARRSKSDPCKWVFDFNVFAQKIDTDTEVCIHTVNGGKMKKTINK